jgi:hypothetical protein
MICNIPESAIEKGYYFLAFHEVYTSEILQREVSDLTEIDG